MFSGIFKEITGFLDKRFLVNFFLPSVLFLAILAGLGVLVQGPADPVGVWSRQSVVIQAGEIVLFLAAVFFVASVLANYSLSVTRLYEGYWTWFPLRWLARLRISYYQRCIRAMKRDEEVLTESQTGEDGGPEEGAAEARWRDYKRAFREQEAIAEGAAQVARQDAVDEARSAYEKAESDYLKKQAGATMNARDFQRHGSAFYYLFPVSDPNSVMPTRLGNILKSAEAYPAERYGIDSVLLWPRLSALLPDSFAQSLAETASDMDRMLVISFLAIVLALLSAPYILWAGGAPWLFLLLLWGGLTVGWLSYEAALAKAVAYGELIRTAYDLYRAPTLAALGYEPPKTYPEERARWVALREFLLQNVFDAALLPLAPPAAPKAAEEGKKTA